MAPPARATAPQPRPPDVRALRLRPTPPQPASRGRRLGLPAPPRAASGTDAEELQEGARAAATPDVGAERPSGLPAQHGIGRKSRATPASASLPPPSRSPVPASHCKITRVGATSSHENSRLSEGTSTIVLRTRTDDMESMRRRLILAESKVAKEKENVRRGLEIIKRKDTQLKELKKRSNAMEQEVRKKDAKLKDEEERSATLVQRVLQMSTETKDLYHKLKTQKEVELQLWIVQKEKAIELAKLMEENVRLLHDVLKNVAQLQELEVQKETKVQKVMKENVRLLCIVDKEAQLQAMSEQCKFLAQQMP